MHKVNVDSDELHCPAYAGRSFSHDIPKYQIPKEGMSADAAYQLVHDELNLDGNPALNLASFVTSWMEPQADKLAIETLDKNLIDQDEYPQTEVIHERVVSMIGRLFHAPAHEQPTGTATIGSSEAIMLAMLAHKRSWQRRREQEGLSTDAPNMVIGADVHTCWEKFARYFEVQARIVADGGGALHDRRRTGRAADRRAHDRGRGLDRHDLHRPDGRPARDQRPARATWNPSTAGTSLCTSTRRAAASSPPSPSRSWSGTSACRRCARSMSQTTSSASSIRGWAPSSSAIAPTCPRSSCFTSTTSAATCPTIR